MNRIREQRIKMGLTQIELSHALNVSQGALSGYETGRYEPDLDMMHRLCDFFHVSMDELFGADYSDNGETVSDIDYALSGEIRELTDVEKRDILDYIRFKRAKRSS